MILRQRYFQLQWVYLKGWLLIVVGLVLIPFFDNAYLQARALIEPLWHSVDSAPLKVVLIGLLLLAGPWLLGKLVDVAARPWMKSRGMQVFQRIERRLNTEFSPDKRQGFRTALIHFPSREVRTIGIVTGSFEEPGSGRLMASVYLPDTPRPTKGTMRIVAIEDLSWMDWSLEEVVSFYATFGSATPLSSEVESGELFDD